MQNPPVSTKLTLMAAIVGCLLLATTLRADAPQHPAVLIDFDATWKYHDGNEDLGTAWKTPDYNDRDWKAGPALLGYDTRGRQDRWPEPGLQTELQENLVTYYFRKSFDFGGSLEGVQLQLDQIIDDAAVYYLNGEEIGRSELMPEGEVGFGTQATRYTNPSVEQDVFDIDSSHLREGRNVLAVMVANNTARSSDICFGARLQVVKDVQTPAALYLTWQRDPTTTMTIQWHTEQLHDEVTIEYGPAGSDELSRTDGDTRPMPHSDRHIQTVELTDLEPGSDYRFRIYRSGDGNSSSFYTFRTMPAEADRPIRIAVGGDTRHSQARMEQTNRVAASLDPDFIVWGGDLAYADGRADRVDRWYEYFNAIMNTLITDEGRVIPTIVGIGNHEMLRPRGGNYYFNFPEFDEPEDYYTHDGDLDQWRNDNAPYFFALFAFPGQPGYGVLDFGDYLSIVLPDTNHANPIPGEQTQWLEQVLADREHVQHVIPVYHVPGYPSARPFTGRASREVREHWSPLFEQQGNIRVAFENHDHAYKRTVPIRDGEEHEDGVVYIGDGAWGVGVRDVHDVDETWYLERAESIRHLILVTIDGQSQDYTVISEHGEEIDHYVPKAR
ncbi:fibronectin type III domain-containing protein [Phycisphaerales bacterium AB-hyl4]|uniref:Fibronectin type III domain-containing protein n=1 Tax=Natronomicrosphaera hydrolytica TaxID=3242702 RepID=A0ABV4U5X8_9BACT